jgi:hypothetical protein
MQTIFTVITDNGDGSNSVEWHKTMSDEKLAKMEQQDYYQSGDGVQLKELVFPDTFDLDMWASINNIWWFNDKEFLLETES